MTYKDFNIYETIDEYRPDLNIFSNEDETILKIKKIIYYRLNETDRRIILTYTQLGNIRDTAKLFKVSPTTIWSKIKKIQIDIKTLL